MERCSQCDKPAVVRWGDIPLCVDHYFKMQHAIYLQATIVAANLDYLEQKISAGTGGLIPPAHIGIPPPPSIGDTYTLNNINISDSTIGAINTGTLQNLDVGITVLQGNGQNDLAAAVTELTEALIKSNEASESLKKEISEQLEFLVAQATAENQNRSIGTVKSVLEGIRNEISALASLVAIWDKAEPLFRTVFGL